MDRVKEGRAGSPHTGDGHPSGAGPLQLDPVHPDSMTLGPGGTGQPSTSAESGTHARGARPLHVLLVDDDKSDRMLIKRLMTKSQHAFVVDEVSSAEAALSRLDESRIDCVLLDFHLPRCSGLEFVDIMHQLHGRASPAVIMVTGDHSQRVGIDSMRRGAADLISKADIDSIDIEELVIGAVVANERAQRGLSDRLDAFSRLVGNAAHSINNPAAIARLSLSAATEALEQVKQEGPGEGFNPTRLLKLLQAADASLSKIASVTGNLERETGTSLGPVQRFDLSDAVQGAVRGDSARIRGKHVECELLSGAALVGDRSQIERMLRDILDNAVEATHEPRPIRLLTSDEGRFANIIIEDEGPGVPLEDAERIFEPLFTTRAHRGALGMGLARATSIIRRHGGTIGVEHVASGGARFHIRLPRAPAEAPLTPRRRTDVRTSRPTILVLDDEPLLRQQYFRVLEGLFDVQLAPNPREAERLLGLFTFDAILSDVSMPGEGGVDFVRNLLRTRPDQAARVIFISGGVVDEDAATFVQRWENGCLRKPIAPSELRSALTRFIKGPRSEDE